MWLLALFDLPVKTKVQRREYARFRKVLLREGFTMLQYSVYARFCRSEDASESNRKHIRSELPPAGEVRLVSVTDRQFSLMEVFLGKSSGTAEEAPRQLQFF